MGKEKVPPKVEVKKAEELGGMEPRSIYVRKPKENYCDKGGHLQRSLVNDPKHKSFWKRLFSRDDE